MRCFRISCALIEKYFLIIFSMPSYFILDPVLTIVLVNVVPDGVKEGLANATDQVFICSLAPRAESYD